MRSISAADALVAVDGGDGAAHALGYLPQLSPGLRLAAYDARPRLLVGHALLACGSRVARRR